VSATVIRGDAAHLPLGDASVDLVVTSPPYWALRAYQDGGEAYDGQIGAEATPSAYVDSLIECTREWMRVLKPTGSLWVNLGDKYAGSPSGPAGSSSQTFDGRESVANWTRRGPRVSHGVPTKSLIGLPWRYAIRCIDELGLILRAEVIWSKPNGLPESVTDRVRRSHEQWFHMVKQPRYFAAVDAIREAYLAPDATRTKGKSMSAGVRMAEGYASKRRNAVDVMNPLGKLPGSVWTIATQPLTVPDHLGVDHFAAFPMEWPRRIVQGWSPSGICTACGEGRRPVVAATRSKSRPMRGGNWSENAFSRPHCGDREAAHHTITGEACACPDAGAPTRPAVVLDPFGGTGTTALVASALGRHGISNDMSADYCRLARWRTTDPGQLAAALQVEKPAVQHVGQSSLLDLLTVGTEGDAA
jgi:DNA modification methylase